MLKRSWSLTTKKFSTLLSQGLEEDVICLPPSVSCFRILILLFQFNFSSQNFVHGYFRYGIAGADGSVRMFDLRHLEHSTIIYEDPSHTPLLRLAWNKQDPNYLATVAMDACEVWQFFIIIKIIVICVVLAVSFLIKI